MSLHPRKGGFEDFLFPRSLIKSVIRAFYNMNLGLVSQGFFEDLRLLGGNGCIGFPVQNQGFPWKGSEGRKGVGEGQPVLKKSGGKNVSPEIPFPGCFPFFPVLAAQVNIMREIPRAPGASRPKHQCFQGRILRRHGGLGVLYFPAQGHGLEVALAFPASAEIQPQGGHALPGEQSGDFDKKTVGFDTGSPKAVEEGKGGKGRFDFGQVEHSVKSEPIHRQRYLLFQFSSYPKAVGRALKNESLF